MPFVPATIPGTQGYQQLDYVEVTANVGVTATTEATSVTFITSNSVTYSGSQRVQIECYMPVLECGLNHSVFLTLWDGATDLGRIGLVEGSASIVGAPVHVIRFLTPSAAAHTYTIRAYSDSAVGSTLVAGAGGIGAYMPAFLRITQA